MLRWRQIQFIVSKLQGHAHPNLRRHKLDEPWRTVYDRANRCEYIHLEKMLWHITHDLDDRTAIIDAILQAHPNPDIPSQFPSLRTMSHDLPPIDWLWPNWIPRGLLTLFGAAPGAGKSLIALDLARAIIHRERWPDGSPAAPDANATPSVIYVDAEAIPQIQNQRAQSWQINTDHLYLMLPSEAYTFLDLGSLDHQDTLVQMAYEIQPQLIIIDSLSSISLKGENNIEDVRAIFTFLSALAAEFDTGLLLIHHLRKRGKAVPAMDIVTADDFRGSSHIIAMARSVLALSIIQDGPQPDRNGPRRLEIVKTNLCAYPEPLGVEFLEPWPVEVAHLAKDGEPGDSATPEPQFAGSANCNELPKQLAPTIRYSTTVPKAYHQPTQTDQCAEWLLDLLTAAAEPLKPKEIIAAARTAGYSRGVLYRARDQLANHIHDTHTKHNPDNTWTLQEHSP